MATNAVASYWQRDRAVEHHRAAAEVDDAQRVVRVYGVEGRAIERHPGDRPAAKRQRLKLGAGGEIEGVELAAVVRVGDALEHLHLGRIDREHLDDRRIGRIGDVDDLEAARSGGDHGESEGAVDRHVGCYAGELDLPEHRGAW